MSITDPIADMLTRIRNGVNARHEEVVIPASRVKVEMAKILKDEGFITDYVVESDEQFKTIKVVLKYGPNDEKVITNLKRISKPGLRVYADVDNIPRVLNGLGIAVLSTSEGLMSDKAARSKKIGGEVLAYVW